MELDKDKIKEDVLERGIQWLVHFTPTFNLLGIFQEGKILSRAKIEGIGVDITDITDFIQFTDEIRYDDKNFINLSIQDCNHFLFNVFRRKTKESPDVVWCVIRIDPSVIWSHDTLFSVTNAANSHNKRHVGISGDFQKFSMMFSERLEVISFNSRRVLTRNGLRKNLTTDEQAEVLIKDEIDSDNIIEICFASEQDLATTKAAFSGYDTSKFRVDSTAFQKNRI